MLPGQTDLNSDRGSRYVTLHSPKTLFLPAYRRLNVFPRYFTGHILFPCFSPVTFFSRAFHRSHSFPVLSTGYILSRASSPVTFFSRAFHRLHSFPALLHRLHSFPALFQHLQTPHICMVPCRVANPGPLPYKKDRGARRTL